MDQNSDKVGTIHVQYHGNHSQDARFFDWDVDEARTSSHAVNNMDDFEEFNLDDCDELTEEEKQLLLMYIQNNHGSVVFADDDGSEDVLPPEPPPDYGEYYSGRFLETIYEEDSDDLRSWDSDDANGVSKTSAVTKKSVKELDKDSSYDSDFSLVNSCEMAPDENADLLSSDEDVVRDYDDDDIEDALKSAPNNRTFNLDDLDSTSNTDDALRGRGHQSPGDAAVGKILVNNDVNESNSLTRRVLPSIDDRTNDTGFSCEPASSGSSASDLKRLDDSRRCTSSNDSGCSDDDVSSRSASEELYSMLPKIGELPDIKDLCSSWFGDNHSDVSVPIDGRVVRRRPVATSQQCVEWEKWLDRSLDERTGHRCVNDYADVNGCPKNESEQCADWDSWLDRSLDERNGLRCMEQYDEVNCGKESRQVDILGAKCENLDSSSTQFLDGNDEEHDGRRCIDKLSNVNRTSQLLIKDFVETESETSDSTSTLKQEESDDECDGSSCNYEFSDVNWRSKSDSIVEDVEGGLVEESLEINSCSSSEVGDCIIRNDVSQHPIDEDSDISILEAMHRANVDLDTGYRYNKEYDVNDDVQCCPSFETMFKNDKYTDLNIRMSRLAIGDKRYDIQLSKPSDDVNCRQKSENIDINNEKSGLAIDVRYTDGQNNEQLDDIDCRQKFQQTFNEGEITNIVEMTANFVTKDQNTGSQDHMNCRQMSEPMVDIGASTDGDEKSCNVVESEEQLCIDEDKGRPGSEPTNCYDGNTFESGAEGETSRLTLSIRCDEAAKVVDDDIVEQVEQTIIRSCDDEWESVVSQLTEDNPFDSISGGTFKSDLRGFPTNRHNKVADSEIILRDATHSCPLGKSSFGRRSKSTPDLSTTSWREETFVKRVEHSSQLRLEVCELSPGLVYKRHCVVVSESVSDKTAKFESLRQEDNSSFAQSKPEVCLTPGGDRAEREMVGRPDSRSGRTTSPCRLNDAEPSTSPDSETCAKTDVGKLVALFESEIKKSDPLKSRHSTSKLVVRGGADFRRSDRCTTNTNVIDVTPEHFNKITGLESGIRATASKPPLPSLQHRKDEGLVDVNARTLRNLCARKQFLNANKREANDRQQISIAAEENDDDVDWQPRLVRLTNDRLSKFQRTAQQDRARLAKSVPDLASSADKAFERTRHSSRFNDSLRQQSPNDVKVEDRRKASSIRRQELSKSRNEDEWQKILSAAAVHYGKRYENAKQRSLSVFKGSGGENQALDGLSKSQGYLETNIDTLECHEVDQTSISNSACQRRPRTKSLANLGSKEDDDDFDVVGVSERSVKSVDSSRAKSMEFLLDDDNKATVIPPENQLMRDGRAPSEHELRFQRSLKNLTLPSWYRDPTSHNDSLPSSSVIKSKNQTNVKTRWQGLGGSKSSSTSSLKEGDSTGSLTSPKPIVIPKRVTADWRYVKYGVHSSRDSLTAHTPTSVPDSPSRVDDDDEDNSSFSYHPSLSRWNTARASSNSNSSFTGNSLYRSFRQPYLGWRSSVEKLPSNSSSQCPSPSSSAISAASSSFQFRSDRFNFSSGLSKWGNLGPINLSYNTDTESEMDFNSRPSSALTGNCHTSNVSNDDRFARWTSWRPSTVGGNQQVNADDHRRQDGVATKSVESESSECRSRRSSDESPTQDTTVPAKQIWMESSFVSKKTHEPEADADCPPSNSDGHVSSNFAFTSSVQPSSADRPQELKTANKATLEDVLDSLLGLTNSAPRYSVRRRYSTLTRNSKSSGNLDAYGGANGLLSHDSSPCELTKPSRHSDLTTPQEDHPDYIQTKKYFEDTSMEFKKVAHELSERIKHLTFDSGESKAIPGSDGKDELEFSELKPKGDILDQQDIDILQQYSCDYSCLNLNVSQYDETENSVHRIGPFNEESLPYYDDYDDEFDVDEVPNVPDIRELRKAITSPEVELHPNIANEEMLRPVSRESAKVSISKSPTPPSDAMAIKSSSHVESKVIKCHRPKCKEETTYAKAQKTYKSCHYCYTVYCSRQCRRSHWERHRRECLFARVSRMCDNTVQKIKLDTKSRAELSKFARTGFLTKGRGVLKLIFSCPELAWHFIDRGWTAVLEDPIYVALPDLLPQEMGADAYVEVRNLCQKYDPDSKFVLIVAIYVTTQIGGVGLKRTPAAGYEREILMKCIKLKLSATNVTALWKPSLSSQKILNNNNSCRPPFAVEDLLKSTKEQLS